MSMSYNNRNRRRSGKKLMKNVLTVATVVLCVSLIGTLFARRPGSDLKTDASDPDKGFTVLGFTGLSSNPQKLSLVGDAAGVASYTTIDEGVYVSVQNELDDMFPFNQIKEYTDEYGNVFVKFPKLYMKWVLNKDGYIDGVSISNKQVDDTYFIPDAYLNPVSSYLSEGLYNDYFSIGKYEMSGDAAQGYSKPGAEVLTNIPIATARNLARSYGTERNLYAGYQQLDISQWTVYNVLCMLYYQTSDIQSVYAGRVAVDSVAMTGTTDRVDGLNGWNTDTGCVKLLGVENPYGNVLTFMDGIYVQDGAAYAHLYPQDYADSIEGAVQVCADVTKRNAFSLSLKPVLPMDGRSGFNGLFFPCGVYDGVGNPLRDFIIVTSEDSVFRVGGSYGSDSNAGLFCVYLNVCADDFGPYTGARLTYRPV